MDSSSLKMEPLLALFVISFLRLACESFSLLPALKHRQGLRRFAAVRDQERGGVRRG